MKEELIARLIQTIIDAAPELRRSFSSKMSRLEGVPLSGHHHYCLIILSQNDKMSMTEIATKLGVSNQQLTRIIDYLVDNGFAERSTDENNRRIILAGITPKGSDIINQCHEHLVNDTKETFGKLSEQELSDFIHYLESITGILKKLRS